MKHKHIAAVFLFIFLCVSISAESINSENKFNLFGKGNTFRLDPVTDGVLLGSGALIYGTELILDKGLKLGENIYNGENFSLDNVNSFDRFLARPYSKNIDKVADGLLISSFVLPAFLFTTDNSEWFTWCTMYAETMLLAQGIKESIKLAVYRPRPYMYFKGFPEKDVYKENDFANSFVSGHATMSFAAATFTGYTFSKYFPHNPWRFAVWGVSYGIAGLVVSLRIAGGNHFLSDVLSGAALGTACGLLVPWLHTLKVGKNDNIQLALIPEGFMVTVKI